MEPSEVCRPSPSLDKHSSQLEDALRDARREIDKLEHQTLRLRGDFEAQSNNLTRQINNYADDLRDARKEREYFRHHLEQKGLEIDHMRQDSHTKQQEFEDLRTTYDVQQKEHEALRASYDSQRRELEALRAADPQIPPNPPSQAKNNVEGQSAPSTDVEIKPPKESSSLFRLQKPIIISDDSDEDLKTDELSKSLFLPPKFEPRLEAKEAPSASNKDAADKSFAAKHGVLLDARTAASVPEPPRKRMRVESMDSQHVRNLRSTAAKVNATSSRIDAQARSRLQPWKDGSSRLRVRKGKEREIANAPPSIAAPTGSSAPRQTAAPSITPTVRDGEFSKNINTSVYQPDYVEDVPVSLNARAAVYPPYLTSSNASNSVSSSSSLDTNPLAGYVSRRFLTKQYKCQPQSWLAKIHPSHNVPQGQQRRLVFSQWANNPGLPPAPGKPGTIIANRLEMLEDAPWSVFVRATQEPLWQYRGEYEVIKSENPLSAAEFQGLPQPVRRQWAKDILRPQSWWCYTSARARIALRRHHLAITPETVEKEVKRRSLAVNEQDILDAFNSGEEILNVLVLKPVGYDSAFQADMEAKFSRWKTRENESSSKSKASSRRQSSRTRKRPRASASEALSGELVVAGNDDSGSDRDEGKMFDNDESLTELEYSDFDQ
ncbi:hypothetical protein EVG20_g6118 [Dentipellis fragilis]|uniref:DUF6697 domain-containing protein n=1 Tax=Dentipellis fragilis TaxID=205917 RepID=A0A4Y9YQ43_9AGAM|nr:hypothetical protein EVG20_g6118 [Dentipellis fragilis]